MSKKIIQFIILGAVLVGFPAISWYYLKSGFEYQKKAFSELMDYGQIPEFAFPAVFGEPLSKTDISDKVAVFGFLQDNTASSDSLLDLYSRLHDQFHDRDEIQFIFFNLNPEYYTTEQHNSIATTYELRDSVQIHFLIAEKMVAKQLATTQFKKPDFSHTLEMGTPIPLNPINADEKLEYPYLVLANNGIIKNYYDYRKESSVKRLVEHLALLMPRDQREGSKLKGSN